MSPAIPHRGEVWLADVPDDKRRPVLVLTRDPMGEYLHAVLCAEITSTIRGLSIEVPIGKEAGLRYDSVANLDNVTLVPRHRLVKLLGAADDLTMRAACQALVRVVGCEFAG